MCGLLGQLSSEPISAPAHFIEDALLKIKHRGPDHTGIWKSRTGNAFLGHVRLSILDLSENGNQPMTDSSGRYTIVFNGEIYNHLEIRNKLKSLSSYSFISSSDTETLLAGYSILKDKILDYLEGMFAFAIFDHTTGSLFCARDRVGKKPFCYHASSQALYFASEIPSLIKLVNKSFTPNYDAIFSMLVGNNRHIVDPYSSFEGIHKLEAGHALEFTPGCPIKVWRWWVPKSIDNVITSNSIRAALESAVSKRMIADVPVGALLSGGIDSTAIVSLMRKNQSNLDTFCLGLNEHDDDIIRAKYASKILGTRHHELFFDPTTQLKDLKDIIKTQGEPIMLLPLIHTLQLSRFIRDRGIKVVMTGHGADELFYGYLGHLSLAKVSKIIGYFDSIGGRSLKYLGSNFADPVNRKGIILNKRHRETIRLLAKRDVPNILSDIANRISATMPTTSYIAQSNFTSIFMESASSITIAGDLPAMMASVETRSPFLDHHLVEMALSAPLNVKIPKTSNEKYLKYLLKETVKDLVPPELLSAPKRGFGFGIKEAALIRGPWKDEFKETILCSSGDFQERYLDRKKIEKIWSLFEAGEDKYASIICRLFAISTWELNLRK